MGTIEDGTSLLQQDINKAEAELKKSQLVKDREQQLRKLLERIQLVIMEAGPSQWDLHTKTSDVKLAVSIPLPKKNNMFINIQVGGTPFTDSGRGAVFTDGWFGYEIFKKNPGLKDQTLVQFKSFRFTSSSLRNESDQAIDLDEAEAGPFLELFNELMFQVENHQRSTVRPRTGRQKRVH